MLFPFLQLYKKIMNPENKTYSIKSFIQGDKKLLEFFKLVVEMRHPILLNYYQDSIVNFLGFLHFVAA